jgi:hypothetical protein
MNRGSEIATSDPLTYTQGKSLQLGVGNDRYRVKEITNVCVCVCVPEQCLLLFYLCAVAAITVCAGLFKINTIIYTLYCPC